MNNGYLGITQAAATVTYTQDPQTDLGAVGVKVVLDVTVWGTGVTLTIQGKDRSSGKLYTLLAGAAVVSNTTNVYTVYPGLPVSANVVATNVLPETWRIIVTPTAITITGAVSLTKTFTVAGNKTTSLLAAATIRVSGSTGNDGVYTIVSSTFDTDHTDIVVSQAVPDETADGSIVSAATYTVGAHLLP